MSKLNAQLGPQATVHAIGAGALALVLVGGWLLVLRPSSARQSARERTIQRLAAAEPRLSQLEEQLGDVMARTEAARGRLERSHQRLGGLELRNERLTSLTNLADECGLRIDRLQPGEVARDGMYLVMPIRMEGVGAYPACARFLHQLLERFSDMSARAFTLEAEPGGGDRRARFGFDLAWFADPAGAGEDLASGSVDE